MICNFNGMEIFKKMIVPVSSEFFPEKAVVETKKLSEIFGSEVIILYVIEKKTLKKFEMASNTFFTYQQKKNFEEKLIKEQKEIATDIIKKRIRSNIKKFEEKVVVGEYSEEIEKAIEDYKATIVVTEFEKWNVLKYRLLEKLKLPIWVAAGGGDVVVGACSNLAPNVKVPKFVKDFSDITNHKAILLYIIDIEDRVLVNENGEKVKASIDELRSNAKKFAERYEKVEIREGIFEEELVKFADEVNAGLVVIGREMKKRSMNREVRKDIAENIHHSVLFLN